MRGVVVDVVWYWVTRIVVIIWSWVTGTCHLLLLHTDCVEV